MIDNLDEKNAMAFLFSCERGEPFAVLYRIESIELCLVAT